MVVLKSLLIILKLFKNSKAQPFQNSQFLIGDVNTFYSIICNGSFAANQQIIWISSFNKSQINRVQNTSSISFGDNGQTLNFASLTLVDEQYYSCGILTINNTYKALNSYYLYVRGKYVIKISKDFSISNKKILKNS